MKRKVYALGMKLFLQPAKYLLPIFGFLLVLSGNKLNAQCASTTDFNSSITLAASQTPGAWYPDRYTPSGFLAPSAGPSASSGRLKQSISASDGESLRSSSYAGAFYNTQGRKLDLGVGANVIQINLYVDPSWSGTGRRMAGLWGTAMNNANAVSGYPIIEYSSEGGTPKFRYFTDGWNDFSANLPAGFTTGWVTLKISIANDGAVTYYVKPLGSPDFLTATTASGDSKTFSSVILQGHNYNPSSPGAGVSYDIYWDNLRTEYKSDVAVSAYNSSLCPGADAVFTLTGQPSSVVTYNLNGGASTSVTLTGGTATVTVPAPVANQTLNLTSYYNPSAPCATTIAVSSTVTVIGGGPVANVTTGSHYCTIQPAIDAASAGDIIQVEQGTYNERLVINKSITLRGDPSKTRNLIVLNGTGLGNGKGIAINNGIENVVIKNITIQNFSGNGGNTDAGIYGLGGNNGLKVDSVSILNSNNASGFFTTGPVSNITINGSEIKNSGGGARGIVIWDNLKKDITITNNKLESNSCCGIEMQDGTATGVWIKNNTIIAEDNAIGLIGLTTGSASARANVIEGNTITVRGRYGIEVKNPNGTGAAAGDGAILVNANNVSLIGGITDARDRAGIVVMRRGVLAGNVDVPTGVRVTNNTVSNFQQSTTSDGFGIVIEGTNHTVTGNTLTGNDVGIQLQAGNGGYPGDGDQSDMADQFFGRGNSPMTCGVDTTTNTYTSNGTNLRVIGMGNGLVTNSSTGKLYCSIQSAINDASTVNGNTLLIGAGTYYEQVIVNKELTIKNQPGVTPVIDFTGTFSGKPTLFDVSVNNVTIEGLKLKVDLSKINSGIIASGAAIDNITIFKDTIQPYQSTGTQYGSYGNRNAVSVNYGGNINYRVASGGVDNISFRQNVILSNGSTAFRSGISADEAAGIFTDNILQSISQDISVRFTSNGQVVLKRNQFKGGGVEIAEPNAGATGFSVQNNIFDGAWANTGAPYTSSLRLRNNVSNVPTTVSGNVFSNHVWGISLENFKNVTVDSNVFNPLSTAAAFRHITVNTKLIASTALGSIVRQAIDATFTKNTFNGSATASNSKAIAFYNHWNDGSGATYGNFQVGTQARMNTFNEGFTNYIYVDNINNVATNDAYFTSNYPEYAAANAAVSNAGYWTKDINAVNNLFVASSGGTPKTYSNMDFTERYTYLNGHIYDKLDNPPTGRVILDLPVHNLTHPADFATIQEAIDAAITVNGDVLVVDNGIYSEQVLVNKKVTIKNQTGATPILNFTGTVTGKPTVFDVSVDSVTISGFHFKIDMSKLRSAVIASGATIDYINVSNDTIEPYGTPAGSYGERNAVSINYAGYRVATGVNHVVFNNNVVLGNALNNSFRSGISADAAAGVFTNNTLQTINQDILVRFTTGNIVTTISNNHLNGGGIEIAEPNSGAGTYAISNNIFDGAWSNTYSNSLRLKHNSGNALTNVSNNTFLNHTWAISLENYKNVTIDGNTFTPLSSAAAFRHITVNTKLLASTALSSVAHQAVSGTFTNNTFNGLASATNSKAIAFYNHYNDGGALYGDFVISTNTFNEGFTKYIFVDSVNNLTTDNSFFTSNYPEYTGTAVSQTAYWTKDIKAVNNLFVASPNGTPKTFGSMTFAERYGYLNDRIYDKNDNANIGRVILDLPVHNITQSADFASIQEAIDASITVNGDIIVVDSGIYVENVLVNKEVELRGSNYNVSPNTGSRSTETIIRAKSNNPQGANPNANDMIRVVANNVKINGFTIDGNNPALGVSTIQYNGIDIHARRGITNLDANDGYHPLNNFIVKNNIIKNIDQRGINLANNGPVSSGNSIEDNKFTACGADPTGGQSILLMTNAYAEILNNVMDVPDNSIGLHLQNFYQNPISPAVMHWTGNTLNVGKEGIGIHTNLFYAPSAQLLVRANTINTSSTLTEASSSLYNWGINVWSSANASTVIVRGNKIGATGGYFTRGINLWNNNNTPQVSLENDTISNSLAGVYASNYDNDYHDANSSTYLVKGVVINNSVNKGIVVHDNNANTNNAGVNVVLSNSNMNSASDTGIVVMGADAMLSFNGATPAGFTGTPFYITLRSNGSNVPSTPIDATNVSFDGLTGATATLAQNFDIEDKINHAIDESGLGFVKVKDLNTFVTTNSFTATSATPKVQRGVDAALPSWTEHVKAGTYMDNVVVNKAMTIQGEGSMMPTLTKINSISPTGNIITVASDNVTIKDLQVEGTSPGSSSTRGIYFNTTVTNATIENILSSLHQYAMYADNAADITTLTVTNSQFRSSGNGFSIDAQAKVNGLTVIGGSFSDNLYGLSSTAYNSGGYNNQMGLTNVNISGVTFNNNVMKGMYFEKLNNAVITGNMMTGNGTTTSSPTGFDVNLKFGTYTNININQNVLMTNGTGSASGGGITVKARNDGATYSANPASLSGLILNQNEVSGSPVGLAIGNNIDRSTVTVQNNLIAGATRGIVVYEAPASSTTTLLNNSIDASSKTIENGDAGSNVVATCNWLGSTVAATNAGKIQGNVTYNPWLLSGTDAAAGTTGFQPSAPCSSRPTAAIAAADNNPICLGGSKDLIVTLTGTAPWSITYSDGTTPVTTTANASPFTINVSPATTHTYTITVLSDANFPAEGSDISGSATVTVTQPATTSISYANTPFCGTSSSEAVTLSGTNSYTGGTFSSTAGLNINAATGTINPFMSTANNYLVTYTTVASGGCPAVSATTNVIVKAIPNGFISGGGTATQNAGTTSTVTFTGSNGVAPYTFTYSINGGSTHTVTTASGSSVTTVPQTNADTGRFVYKLLSVADNSGCLGMVDVTDTTIVKVVPPVSGNPDLKPSITMSNPSFSAASTSRSYTLKVFNVGDAPTSGTIGLYILKPMSDALFSMTFPSGWNVSDIGGGYYYIENTSLTINGGFAFTTLTGQVNVASGASGGTFQIQTSIAPNSGGDNSTGNNNANVKITKSN